VRLCLTTIALLSVGVTGALGGEVTTLNGAGATFPYPIYSKWFDDYNKIHPSVQINYQSIGSGGGIRQVIEKTVDFGATDSPMTDDQLSKVDGKILHIPTVLGAVVPVYHVPGVNDLRLTGELLADIFLGKVTRWNDPVLRELNPGVTFPDAPITVIHRSEGSGTTFCFVDYLSKVSPVWEKKVGRGTSVNWPVGLGGKGNEGVSGLVKQMPNTLGYVELIYAGHNGLTHAAVKNASGVFVKGSVSSVTAAAGGAAKTMPKDYRVSITNAPGLEAYPISTFTWLLIFEKNSGMKGQIIKDFLGWMLDGGQKVAPGLGYAPLPKSVADQVKKTIQTIH
jgi:phosphate transport system substrate-binding protein